MVRRWLAAAIALSSGYSDCSQLALIYDGEVRVDTTRTGALVETATDPLATLAEQHDAFGEIVKLYQDMAYGCAQALLGDPYLAEDAAQQAFITAWHRLGSLRVPDAFPGWFKRIVFTECHRLRRRRRETIPLCIADASLSLEATPQQDVEADEVRETLSLAVEALPDNERVVVVLFYAHELSHAEMSAFLGVPTTTVAKRLHTAKRRLKELLPAEFNAAYAARRPSADERFAERVRLGIYDAYVGRYRFDLRPDLTVTVQREGDRLVSEAAGQRNEICAATSSLGELSTREFDGCGRFLRDGRGRVTHLVYYEHGHEMGVATKIA
jgi:RNA polymerase sigma factor (sigma-70 family)